MGICCSTRSTEQGNEERLKGLRSTGKVSTCGSIDTVEQYQLRRNPEVTVLLLGAGESGKTTILKQMKMVYGQGFTPADVEHYRREVFFNLTHAMTSCLEMMSRQGFRFDDATLVVSLLAACLTNNPPTNGTDARAFPAHYKNALRRLWENEGVRAAVATGNTWGMPENMHYFFPALDRIFAPDFVPTNLDVLNCRRKSSGITETRFDIENITYRVFDMGGQRSERAKWIEGFNGVTAVLFLVAISAYDECLMEDHDANAMTEALILFERIANSKLFQRSAIILLFNKIDRLKAKIKHSRVSDYFPEYRGPDADYAAALTYFKSQFVQSARREIFTHFTCATDAPTINVVMASVSDIILQQNLASIIL